ncbi:MAG: class I SAM-dependent RNA methyltransferase [Rhodobacteraceae bacterium]|nr:class I SAM-dependent RNA methyltransferase [Paracoccaceae bacterium]
MERMRITRLGHKGDGIGAGGVLVPRGLPGEEVEGEVDAGRMDAPRIVTPCADRVRPPCSHFKTCGGCALQHASDPFLGAWKQDVVAAALAARGIGAEFRPIAVSPARSRRRAALAGRRMKKGALVGFHARRSDTVVAVTDCHLLTPALNAVMPVLSDITMAGGSRKGEITFTVTDTLGGVDVVCQGGKPMDPALNAALVTLAHRGNLARLVWNAEQVVQLQTPAIRFDGIAVSVPPGAFLQATAAGEAALRDAVRRAVGDPRRIADLFAGCGTFALPLARGAEVLAVEGEAALLAALETAWRRAAGLHAIRTQTRDLFRRPLQPDELRGLDAVVIDPPRAGAAAQMAELAASAVPVIAAVSCNPVTFARDAETLLTGGYRLDWVQVVDQFRWSPHVELAARFVRD